MTRICVVLTGRTMADNIKIIENEKAWVDMAELRVDCLEKSQYPLILSFLESMNFPVILTCRRKEDGGFFTAEQEAERQNLLLELMDLPFQFVDLETDLTEEKWTAKAEQQNIKIIRSFHDFNGTPPNLDERINAVDSTEIPKAAVSLNNYDDYKVFLDSYCENAGRERIVLAMGAEGLFSRVLSPLYSMFLTFTAPEEGLTGAPGQICAKDLCKQYHFREMDPQWKVLGIIGNPLGHSKSPIIHNSWIKEGGLRAVYLPFPLNHISCLKLLKDKLPLMGLSVTIPYKVDVISQLDEFSDRVDKIGACNTLYKEKGKWKGENTDAPGFLKPLLDKLGCSDLLGKKVTVIGAGGAARGIVYSLCEAGADVLVLNRTPEKAQRLAEEFQQKWATLDEKAVPLIEEYGSIIIQTTGVGMHPHVEGDPIPFYDFSGDEVLYDIIYNPTETKVMKRAEAAGATILGGYPMLNEQARMQFKLFSLELDRKN